MDDEQAGQAASHMMQLLIDLGLMDTRYIKDELHVHWSAKGMTATVAMLSYLWGVVEERIAASDSLEKSANDFEIQQNLQAAIENVVRLWQETEDAG